MLRARPASEAGNGEPRIFAGRIQKIWNVKGAKGLQAVAGETRRQCAQISTGGAKTFGQFSPR
jgi:hypothetical protein